MQERLDITERVKAAEPDPEIEVELGLDSAHIATPRTTHMRRRICGGIASKVISSVAANTKARKLAYLIARSSCTVMVGIYVL